MAALLPGASTSFGIADKKGSFGAQIDDAFLADLPSRKKHAAARIPKLVDVLLEDVLGLTKSKLEKKLVGAQVILSARRRSTRPGNRVSIRRGS